MISKNPYRKLEKQIGYRFKSKELLALALTHPSNKEPKGEAALNNQRLEFLGDAALGFVTAHELYKHHPNLREGSLTKMRSLLTSGDTLAAIAATIDIGEHLQMGKGEAQSGGAERPSNLTDAMEAVIGAAFLDRGLSAVSKIFETLFWDKLQELPEESDINNPKSALQEHCQKELKTSPVYRLLREEGPSHARVFHMEVLVENEVCGVGEGSSKRDAEQVAASVALEKLQS